MGWDRVIGQERVKELLQKIFLSGTFAHAYLFYGGEGVGKDAMAIECARALNCHSKTEKPCGSCTSCLKIEHLQHPNVQLIVPLPIGKNEKAGDDPIEVLTHDQIEILQKQLREKAANPYHRISIPKANFIKVNSVRQLRRDASLTGFDQGKKVFIISGAESMNEESSNSLLKLLEEPPADTVFILTTPQKEKLLSTIISRCQLVQFDPLRDDDIQRALVARHLVEEEQALLVARLAHGSYSAACEMLTLNMMEQRQETVEFLRLVLGHHHVRLIDSILEKAASNDRDTIAQWLSMLHVWLRDALILREYDERQLVNIDHLKELKSFVEKFPRSNLPGAIECVERSVALLDKNVYLHLILITLAIDLRKHIIR
ncbi:MAG: DNA polymerase III subunit delta' [bacterium]